MSAPDLTAAIMEQFRASGAESHLTLVLGAGASVPSGLPAWDELAVRLLLNSESVTDRAAAELLVSKQDPLLAAEAARQSTGDGWEPLVRRSLYQGIDTLSPSSLHEAVAGHVLDGLGDDTTIATLNFDTLIEDAMRYTSDQPVRSLTRPAPEPNGLKVHHLHGVVEVDSSSDVILTLSDFNRLLGDAHAWQLELLCGAAQKGAILIAGTTYRDPDLRRWLHVALETQPEEHSTLVLLARQAFDLSQADFTMLREALAEQWNAAGIEAVLLQDHSDAAQIIRELRHVHLDEYLAPQQRAAIVWNAHVDAFDELQGTYSDQLAVDASELRGILGVTHLNITLWLSNANGELARWASHDSLFRSVDLLRLIPSGHDSHWIAGQAMGREQVLFQNLDNTRMRRWQSVLAVPISVEHSNLPKFTTAVLSIGLPDSVEDYESSSELMTEWLDAALFVANSWSKRLVSPLYDGDAYTETKGGSHDQS